MANKSRRFKEGDANLWWILATALIVIIIIVFTIIWFNRSGGKAFGTIEDQIIGLKDCDKDGVLDPLDKCLCENFGSEENSNAKGCPKGKEATPCTDDQQKEC